MKLSEWVLLGGTVWLIKEGLQKDDYNDKNNNRSDYLPDNTEVNRWQKVNDVRKSTKCYFDDGLSENEFVAIATKVGKKIQRIESVEIHGSIIECNVLSQSGLTDWNFTVDFNNWGHITGTYWLQTDNNDSSLPQRYGQWVSGLIHEYYASHDIYLPDFSDAIDENKDLGTSSCKFYYEKKPLLKRIFKGKDDEISVDDNSFDLKGEHFYYVISKLKQYGFKNISSVAKKDATGENGFYPYEVQRIIIGDTEKFNKNEFFDPYTPVVIYYHEKLVVKMPYSVLNLQNKNYEDVANLFFSEGFTNIYFSPVKDLTTGLIKKDGSVVNVEISDAEGKEAQIVKEKLYSFDSEIIISYHTFRYH